MLCRVYAGSSLARARCGSMRLLVVTASKFVAAFAATNPSCHVLHLPNLQAPAVGSAIAELVSSDEEIYIAAPYEFAIGAAAEFVDYWHSNTGRVIQGAPSINESRLSRDKEHFSDALKRQTNCRIISEVVELPFDGSAEDTLLDVARRFAIRNGLRDIILKPMDAAASIGVRPMTLDATDAAQRAVLAEVIDIVRHMPMSDDTRQCKTSHLLLQERMHGDEFSVETIVIGRSVETLGVHWKVDIDSDPYRFFERLFVTLDMQTEIYGHLTEQNKHIIKAIYPEPKIVAMHAEYRYDDEVARPLEIALRPGGGMVPHSIAAHTGQSTYDAWITSRRRDVRRARRPHILDAGVVAIEWNVQAVRQPYVATTDHLLTCACSESGVL